MSKVTFHFPTMEAALSHIEQLAAEMREKAEKAETAWKAGRPTQTKARTLADFAEARGMHNAVQMIREAEISSEA